MVLAATCQAAQPRETVAAKRQATPPLFPAQKDRKEHAVALNLPGRLRTGQVGALEFKEPKEIGYGK